MRFPDLSLADERLLLDGYAKSRIEGFREAMRVVAARHCECEPQAVTLIAVALLMGHLKSVNHMPARAAARRMRSGQRLARGRLGLRLH